MDYSVYKKLRIRSIGHLLREVRVHGTVLHFCTTQFLEKNCSSLSLGFFRPKRSNGSRQLKKCALMEGYTKTLPLQNSPGLRPVLASERRQHFDIVSRLEKIFLFAGVFPHVTSSDVLPEKVHKFALFDFRRQRERESRKALIRLGFHLLHAVIVSTGKESRLIRSPVGCWTGFSPEASSFSTMPPSTRPRPCPAFWKPCLPTVIALYPSPKSYWTATA